MLGVSVWAAWARADDRQWRRVINCRAREHAKHGRAGACNRITHACAERTPPAACASMQLQGRIAQGMQHPNAAPTGPLVPGSPLLLAASHVIACTRTHTSILRGLAEGVPLVEPAGRVASGPQFHPHVTHLQPPRSRQRSAPHPPRALCIPDTQYTHLHSPRSRRRSAPRGTSR